MGSPAARIAPAFNLLLVAVGYAAAITVFAVCAAWNLVLDPASADPAVNDDSF